VGAAEGEEEVGEADGVELPESLEEVDGDGVELEVVLDDEDDDEPERLSVL